MEQTSTLIRNNTNDYNKKSENATDYNYNIEESYKISSNNPISSTSSTAGSINDSLLFTMDTTKNIDALNIPANVPAYDKEKTHQYSLISYLTSKKKPDVYLGDLVIKARNYKISANSQQKPLEPKISEKLEKDGIIQDDSSNDSSVESEVDNYEKMKQKDLRYYAIGNITIKCYNCNEVGHTSRNCPNDLIITCTRCNGKGHDEYECPNIKCFKCNRIGHKSFECKVSIKDIIKCDKCKNIGHEYADCLINPEIRKKDLKNAVCYFCGKTGHFICPINKEHKVIEDYHSDHVVMSESEIENENGSEKYRSDENFYEIIQKDKTKESIQEKVEDDNSANKNNIESLQKKKRKRIFNAFRNEEIKRTVFCPKCGGQHKFSTCTVQLKYNTFDQLRQNYSKFLFKDDERGGADKTYSKSKDKSDKK
jgi:hypothetical protein